MENIKKEVLANYLEEVLNEYLEISEIPDDFIIDGTQYCVRTSDEVYEDINRYVDIECESWIDEINYYLDECPFRECISINEEQIYNSIDDSTDLYDVYDEWNILLEEYKYKDNLYTILCKDI